VVLAFALCLKHAKRRKDDDHVSNGTDDHVDPFDIAVEGGNINNVSIISYFSFF
jgi:hypothetical protein